MFNDGKLTLDDLSFSAMYPTFSFAARKTLCCKKKNLPGFTSIKSVAVNPLLFFFNTEHRNERNIDSLIILSVALGVYLLRPCQPCSAAQAARSPRFFLTNYILLIILWLLKISEGNINLFNIQEIAFMRDVHCSYFMFVLNHAFHIHFCLKCNFVLKCNEIGNVWLSIKYISRFEGRAIYMKSYFVFIKDFHGSKWIKFHSIFHFILL